MSHEELAVLATSLPRSEPRPPDLHAATPRATTGPATTGLATTGPATTGLGATGVAVLLVLGLGLGFAAGQVTGVGTGTALADQATADRLVAARLAATRVMIWADGATVPGEDVEGPPLSVSLVAAGEGVVLERLVLGGATVVPDSPLTLPAGVRVDAELHLADGCLDSVAPIGASDESRESGSGELGFPAHAVVRLTAGPGGPGGRGSSEAVRRTSGGDGEHDVPLDVLGDPAGVLLPLLARCAPGTGPAARARQVR